MDQCIEHDGLRFRVRIDGPEGAPWMVCSNSLVTDLELWAPQVAAFAGRYRILRYDQRGHGGTDVPHGAASFEQLADDAAALMTHFGVRDSVFIGVSMGAVTGYCLAARAPHLVGGLVASDGQPATAPGGAAAWQERIDIGQQGGMGAYADVTIPRWFSAASRAGGNPAIAPVRAMIENTAVAGFVACARALQAYDFRAGLQALTQPTLLVAGAEDGPMSATLRALEPLMPKARFIEIADAGHLPGIERPAAFNAALEAFLA